MAKDKFTPIDPSIVDQTDDESSAPAGSPTADPLQGSPTPSPLTDPSVVASANTPAAQRTPVQQSTLADAVAREQEGQSRQALVKAAEAIKKKYPEGGDRYPDPGSDEDKILKLYEQEYGQGNLKQATDQANMDESIPTVLKPLVAAGQGALAAVDQAGYAMGVGSGEFKPTTPGGATGHVTKSVTQFITGMVASTAAMSGQGIMAGAGKLADAGRLAVAGGASGSLFQDPHEENLSNLVEQHSTLLAPIADFMAAKPEDTEAVARTKKFFENAGLGLATDGLLATLKFLKLRRAAAAGDKTAAAQIPAAADEIQKVVQSKGTVANVRPLPGKEAEFAAQNRGLISPEDADKLRESVDNTVVQKNGGTHFNFEHLPDNYDAKAMINEVSKVVDPAIQKVTGGVQSLQATEDLAGMLGQKPSELLGALAKDAVGANEAAARVVAGKSLLVDLSQQITDQSRVINAAVANGADTAAEEAKLLKLMNIHADLQVNLKGAITGAARTTSAGRIDVKEAAQLFAMADGNPVAIAKLVRPLSMGEKVSGVIAEWRANCLLSGVTTLAKKATADMLQGIALPAGKIIGGVAHGQLPAIKEGAATWVGMFKGIGDAFSMARMALNNGTQFLDAGHGAIDAPRHAISSQQGGVIGSLVNALGSVVRIPTRLIGTLDEFSKQLNYRGALYAQATREGTAKGLTGDALASWIEDFSAKAFDDAGRGTNTEALQYAKEATFTQDLDHGLAKWLQDGANQHPAVRAVLPFIRVPTNLFRTAVQYTPGIQALSSQWRADLQAGGTRAASARGKQIIGGMMYAQAVNLATSGRITGAGPQDPEARKALQATGWQPYSFKIGKEYYSYSWLDPWAHMFGMTADFAEAAGQMNNDTADKVATSMVLALARNLSSKTYYAGAVQTLDAMRGDENKAMKFLQGFTGSFVPNTRQFTDILPVSQDPYMREARTVLDGIRKKIPGLSTDLPPVRNLFGEAVPMPAAFGPDTLSPFHTSTGTDDATLNELAKFPKGFSLPAKKVGNVDLSQIPSKEGGHDAYDRLLQLNGSVKVNGKNLKDHLAEFIKSDKYQKLTDDGPGYSGSKFEELSGIIAQHRGLAQAALQKENEGVRKALKGDRDNQKAALTKGPEAVNPLSNLMQALQPH